MVDFFEALDQIADVISLRGSTGCWAIVGATAEGSAFVDATTCGPRIEERAGAVGRVFQSFSSGGSPRFGGNKGFATSEIGGVPDEAKAAAIGQAGALSFDGTLLPLGIDFTHFAECLGQVRMAFHGIHGVPHSRIEDKFSNMEIRALIRVRDLGIGKSKRILGITLLPRNLSWNRGDEDSSDDGVPYRCHVSPVSRDAGGRD